MLEMLITQRLAYFSLNEASYANLAKCEGGGAVALSLRLEILELTSSCWVTT